MLVQRTIGIFKLDRSIFEEIEHDESATTQAALVVAAVAALSVVGNLISLLFSLVRGTGVKPGAVLLNIVVTFAMMFVNWAIWSAVTYFVGTQLFKGEATFTEMLRLIGFAYAPRVLGIIPCIGSIVGAVWSLIASYFAIKEGLDLDDTGTIVTIVVGWLITIVIGIVVGSILGIGAFGVGALGSLLGR